MQAKKPEDIREEETLPFDFNPIEIPEEQIRKHWDLIKKAILDSENNSSSES